MSQSNTPAMMAAQSAAGRLRKRRKQDPAKRAARIAAYEERCQKLAARAEQLAATTGIVGNVAAALKRLDAAERRLEEKAAREYVAGVLAGPLGDRLTRWVGKRGLQGDPCKVALVVKNWVAAQGGPG